MRRTCLPIISLAGCLLGAGAASAEDGAFARVLQCKNDDARVELYLPSAIVYSGKDWRELQKPTTAYYALDLSEAGKGKPLEPVRVTLTKDRKGLIVNQNTRGLPPTTVPFAGGKVSFDKRFAEDMECGPIEPR